MHQCTHCQAELAANAQFCRHCGTPVHAGPSPTPDTATQQEDTSKLPTVSASPLPALRTRRMHPQSSISTAPPDPWLSTTPEHVDQRTPTGTAPGQQTPRPQARPFPARIFSPTSTPTPPPASPIDKTGKQTVTEDAQADFPAFEEMETFEETTTSSSPIDLEETETGATEIDDSSSPTDLEKTETGATEIDDSSSPTDLEEIETGTTEIDNSSSPTDPEKTETGMGTKAPSAQIHLEGNRAESSSPSADSEQAEIGHRVELPPSQTELEGTETPTVPLTEEPPIETLDTVSLPTQPEEQPHSEKVPAEEIPLEARATDSLPASALDSAAEALPSSTPATIMRPSTRSATEPAPSPPTPVLIEREKHTGKRRKTILLVALVVALIVLVGAGTLVAFRQQIFPGFNAPQGSPTSTHRVVTQLTFSGAVAGKMTEITPVSCRDATAGDLHTLTVTLSGMVHNRLYNFGFTIGHYNGPGVYTNSTSANSLTVLLNLPGESTANGWGNTDPAANGSITIDRGGQTGSISYTLSGFGKQAGAQIQVSGSWSCSK